MSVQSPPAGAPSAGFFQHGTPSVEAAGGKRRWICFTTVVGSSIGGGGITFDARGCGGGGSGKKRGERRNNWGLEKVKDPLMVQFTYMYHTNQLNVGEYTIDGWHKC